MRKRYPTPVKSLQERLADHATQLREEAKALPPGTAREEVLKRAGQADAGADMSLLLHLTTRR
jgi:hypothetical protein